MRHVLVVASLFAAFLAYAVVRYVVFAGVPMAHVPVYVTNKAVSLLAMVLLVVAVAGAPAHEGPSRRALGLVGAALAVLHVVMSLAILSPAYFAKLYDDPSGATGLGAWGEIAVLTGCVASVVLAALVLLSSKDALPGDRAALMRAGGTAVVSLTVVHCLAIGWRGWWPPSSWPGMMPPITLLAVTFTGAWAIWHRRNLP